MIKTFWVGALLVLGLYAGRVEGSLLSGIGESTSLGFPSIIDFEAAPAGLHPSITIGGVTFTGIGAPVTIGPDFAGSFNTRGTQSLFTDFDLDPDVIEIDFTGTVSDFAFNWGAADNTWLMEAFDSSSSLIESHLIAPVIGSNAGDYYGISATGIASIRLTDTFDNFAGGDYIFIDNFVFRGADAAIPEPTSIAIFGLGCASLIALRRRVA